MTELSKKINELTYDENEELENLKSRIIDNDLQNKVEHCKVELKNFQNANKPLGKMQKL